MTRWLKKLIGLLLDGFKTFKPIGRAVVTIQLPRLAYMMDGSYNRVRLAAA